MPQIINTNILSLTAQRNLNGTQNALAKSIQRLSSGLRINSAKDDAAGMAIVERFTSQIRGLNQAIRNANDGISFGQTAEGALSTAANSMQRIRELAVQSANDTNSASDRQALNNEVQQLIAEVNRIANSTQFNGQNILDGSSSTLVFQVGANQNQTISVNGVDSRGSQLGARVATAGSVTATEVAAMVAGNALVIQGNSIDLTGVTTVEETISAVNNVASSTGVQAQKATTVDTGDIAADLAVPAGADGVFTINGVQVTIANDGADNVDVTQTIANINALSTQTGVTASEPVAGEIHLSNTSGADVALGGANYNAGTAETFQAGIVLASKVGQAFTVAGGYTAASGADLDGSGQADQTLNGVDVLNRTAATSSLLTLDFAVQQVNTLRSELGAVQIRFESTIANLQITTENLSAARSRIQDADFAAETAELTRNQILQQAGLAVVAQANALPQSVLSLLQ